MYKENIPGSQWWFRLKQRMIACTEVIFQHKFFSIYFKQISILTVTLFKSVPVPYIQVKFRRHVIRWKPGFVLLYVTWCWSIGACCHSFFVRFICSCLDKCYLHLMWGWNSLTLISYSFPFSFDWFIGYLLFESISDKNSRLIFESIVSAVWAAEVCVALLPKVLLFVHFIFTLLFGLLNYSVFSNSVSHSAYGIFFKTEV